MNPTIVRIVFLLLFLVGYLILTFYQIKEVRKPATWYTSDRWAVLAIFGLTTITLVPSLVFQSLHLTGIDSDGWRDFSTYALSINGFATMILIYMIYFKKRKE